MMRRRMRTVRGVCSMESLQPEEERAGPGKSHSHWEGTEGITGEGMSVDKKECSGIVEILMEKGVGKKKTRNEGAAWKINSQL